MIYEQAIFYFLMRVYCLSDKWFTFSLIYHYPSDSAADLY